MRRHKPIIHRLILAFLVAIGAEVAWGLMASFVDESLPQERASLEAAKEPTRTARGILIRNPGQIHVQCDGTVLVSEDGYDPELTFFNLDLHPVSLSGNERWVFAAQLREPLRPQERNGGAPWRERLSQIILHPLGQVWYFVHDGRRESRGYFVGYDAASKLSLGYIGKRGFSPQPPPRDEQYEGDGRRLWSQNEVLRGRKDGRWSYPGGIQMRTADALLPESVQFLLSGGRLWKIDLAGRSAAPLTEDEGIVSFDIVRMPAESDDNAAAGLAVPESAGLVVRTATTIKLLDLDGRQKFTWPIADVLRDQGVSWFVLDDGNAMAEWSERQGEGPYWTQMQIARIAPDGTASRKQSFEFFQQAWESRGWTAAVTLPAPVLFIALLTAMYWSYSAAMQANPIAFTAAISDMLAENWGVLVLLSVVSALLAVLAYRRQTRFALPGAGAWAVFVFLFGAPGWLAYRWHRHWPVLEACNECHRPAPRDRESCVACGQVFAPPPLTGTEVFA